MRPVYYLLMAFYCLFTFSCTEEISTLSDESTGEENEILLGARINLMTRANDDGFELNDSMGLFLVQWTDATTPGIFEPSGNYADNILYQLTTLPDSWTAEKKSYYPTNGTRLDFHAYYPFRSPAFAEEGKIQLEVAADQTDYQHYTRSDFMTAKEIGVQRRADKVHLNFYHRLSQICFTLKPGIGVSKEELQNAEVTIVNAITDGTFKLGSSVDSIPVAGNTKQNVIPYGEWTDGEDNTLCGKVAILMPQEINTTTYLQVTIGERKYSYKPTTPNLLESGYSQEFIITVNHTNLDIETQIHPWKTRPAIQVDAEEDTGKDYIVKMTTLTEDTIRMTVEHYGDVTVDWGDGNQDVNVFNHIYTDKAASHEITFRGSDTAITALKCLESKLTELDIAQNTMLRMLLCDMNQLTTLDVSQNINLDTLMCYQNLLSKIDISKNINLRILYLDKNQLTNLDVSKNTLLEKLGLGSNPIIYLNIDHNPKLQEFYCANSLLKSLDISNNSALRLIDCTGSPFITESVSANAFANSLPERSKNNPGYLYISNQTIRDEISSICQSKNWNIH